MKKYVFTVTCIIGLMALMLLPSAAADFIGGKEAWKAEASSQSAPLERALDGDPTTYWHSHYETVDGVNVKDPMPYDLIFTLPEVTDISGFAYYPRQQSSSTSGRVLKYKFYIAGSDTDEFVLAAEGDFANDDQQKVVNLLCNVPVKRVNFQVIDGLNGYGTMGEFDLIKPSLALETVAVSEYLTYAEENKIYEIDPYDFAFEADSVWGEHKAKFMFDGNSATFWHENPGDKPPFCVTVDMGEATTVSGFFYLPRQDDIKGHWKTFSIYQSNDGVNYTPVLEDEKIETIDFARKQIPFPQAVTTRYLQFEISEYHGHCAAAEITLYQTQNVRTGEKEGKSERYVLQIGNPILQWEKGETAGETVLDVSPYIKNSNTLIPLRGLLEEMGAEVEWNGDNQTVFITKGSTKIEMQIYNKQVYVTTGRYGRVRYAFRTAPIIRDSRTFIPLRFISEHLGYIVSWDGETQTITIASPSASE